MEAWERSVFNGRISPSGRGNSRKNFPIRGSHALEFRTEFFNVPNTVNFSDPIGVMNDANFGRITSQRTPPRQIQFSLRYRF